MIDWVLFYQVWIIIGIIFVLLELTDGSAIFFLPLGIGSFFESLYIYIADIQLISPFLIIDKWYFLIVMWAVLSLITSLLISTFWKRNTEDNKDINQY